jgi:cob(I)alamin adenosyltransferase
MPDPGFDQPRIVLNRIYTRQGDSGQTHLAAGQSVAKDSARIECYGTVDELNAFLGLAQLSASGEPKLAELAGTLRRVQHELFNLGSLLATLPEDLHPKQARITAADTAQLEQEIDQANAELPPLRSFVLPGGSRVSAELHVCRTVCRRAERLLVRMGREEPIPEESLTYLNRLSDALFVWSRWANHLAGAPETLWQPNEAASAKVHS